MLKPSPFAPDSLPNIPEIDGVRLGAAKAGIKYKDRTDLFLAELVEGTQVAGVLTKSLTRSAPIDWCRKVLPGGTARAILVNSGNANAFTGSKGVETTEQMVASAAKALGCTKEEVLIASTGVIGEQLPADKVEAAMPALSDSLRADNWELAAKTIMTTDTFPKAVYVESQIGDIPVKIGGIAKGSGMIAPDMATMLSFVFTDANIPAPILRALLKKAVDRSFNCMTVDGDTSTSDTLILAATGKAGNIAPTKVDAPALDRFAADLEAALVELAQLVAKDGEGASKFITIDVTGAENDRAAKVIALSIANSPLVKTAIAGEDANWGRVVMAVGKAGERADRDRLSVSMGGVTIARDGEGVDDYDEAPVAAHLKGMEIHIEVDVGIAKGKARVWTCDLTHGYIDINADYRS